MSIFIIILFFMNFLAHARLSFNHPQILVGNMISDFVKGKKQFDYPVQIQKGIKLHRAIDEFTDAHAATKEMKLFFKPYYQLYAGAFCDVAYDYFLANDTTEFINDNALAQFATDTYKILDANLYVLPEVFKITLPYMKENNWLYNYKSKPGIEKSFAGLVRRAKYLSESNRALDVLNTNYKSMESLYNQFYPDVKDFALKQLGQLLIN